MLSFSLKWCIAIDKAEIHILVIHGILWLSLMIDNMKCSINMLSPDLNGFYFAGDTHVLYFH